MKKKKSLKILNNINFLNNKLLFQNNIIHYFIGMVLLVLVIYVCISMISFFFSGSGDQCKIEGLSLFHSYQIDIEKIENWTGLRGAIISNSLMNEGFGISTFFLLFFLFLVSLRLMKVYFVHLLKSFIFCSLLTIWSSITLAFFFEKLFKETAIYIGGKHGLVISCWLIYNFGKLGTFLFILLIFFLLLIVFKKNEIFFSKKKKVQNQKKTLLDLPFLENPSISTIQKEKFFEKDICDRENFEVIKAEDEEIIAFYPKINIKKRDGNDGKKILNNLKEKKDRCDDPSLSFDLSWYRFPFIGLLKEYSVADIPVNMEEQTANKNKILFTLDSFGIKIVMIKATVGPTITLYEIQPVVGVRVSKIKNLENDIALRLSALGIRIIAPIPGKGTIGIEVPNKKPQIVSIRSVLISKKFQEALYDLPIALGKTITNETFVFDLCKMPHLLVAGATGQGKSVGLHAIITSLLYKKHPSQLKFVLIDPKKVEFNIYSAIENHFLSKLPNEEESVITDTGKVIKVLNSLIKEMDTRYNMLKISHSRNIKEYNEKFMNHYHGSTSKEHRYMPYIVVIIDEFGDLIMNAGKEVELPITRISQLARAVGIHMIIATQRPSTDIITGVIKANFPARIAFRVSAMVDSRTILDASGANQLIGNGDLLFSQGTDLIRIQCAFVDILEVEKITKYIGGQCGYSTAEILPDYEYKCEGYKEKFGIIDFSERDPLFSNVARLIVTCQIGSTSLIQRKFEVGYNRAGRLMDQMEAMKIVGASRGSKPREVLIADEYHLEKILNSSNL